MNLANKCLNLRIRSKGNIKYQVCLKNGRKGQINENLCYMCPFKELKKYKKLKNRTEKQKKLEESRYSILTDNMYRCYICGKPKDDIHEIYPGSKRIISIKNGLCIPICRECHQEIQNNEVKMLIYKMMCQKVYEKTHTREEFIKLIGRNYLWD